MCARGQPPFTQYTYLTMFPRGSACVYIGEFFFFNIFLKLDAVVSNSMFTVCNTCAFYLNELNRNIIIILRICFTGKYNTNICYNICIIHFEEKVCVT